MRPTKYNRLIETDILALYAEGYTITFIAKRLRVTRKTLQTWIKKYDLREEMEKLREDEAKQAIEAGLLKLAKGTEDETLTEKYVTNRVATIKVFNEETLEQEEVTKNIPVEKTYQKKIKAPDSKAIEILSRKYAKEFDPKSEERELTTNILEGFTMRQLQEARKNNPIDSGASIEAEFKELSNTDSD